MLLWFAMLTLICALMAGVFGHEDAVPSWLSTTNWLRNLFIPLLTLSVALLTSGALTGRPDDFE